MRWNNAVDMICHYFQLGKEGLGEELTSRVREAILGNDAKGVPALALTPAQLEQLSAEHDDVHDMVAALETKALHVIGAMGAAPALPPSRHPSAQGPPQPVAGGGTEEDPQPILPTRGASATVTYE